MDDKRRRCCDEDRSESLWSAVSSGTFKATSSVSSSSYASSNTSPVPTTATEQNDKFLKLGVGISVPVGIAAFAAIGLVLWRRRGRYHGQIDDPYQSSEMPDADRKVHEVGVTRGEEGLHELLWKETRTLRRARRALIMRVPWKCICGRSCMARVDLRPGSSRTE